MLEGHISKEEALERIRQVWRPAPGTEAVALINAKGRITAEDHFAKYSLPVVRAAGMDGIAVDFDLLENGAPDSSGWIRGNEYDRADTGDDFDDKYDTVLPIEWISGEGDGIKIDVKGSGHLRRGMNVKPSGATIEKGELLVKAGTEINALDIATLATGGHESVKVIKEPIVTFIPTGSELVPVGTEIKRGQNFDANSLMVAAMLEDMGAEPIIGGAVKDDCADIEKALDAALEKSDIVLLNGGSSKGDEDFNTRIMAKKGRVLFHWVLAAPGRPMSAAVINDRLVINLAGPTMAAYHGIYWCVREAIAYWYGRPVRYGWELTVRICSKLPNPPLSLIIRLQVEKNEEGILTALPVGAVGKGKHPKISQPEANAFYITSPGEKSPEEGDDITVIMTKSF